MFLAIIIALIVLQLWGSAARVHSDQWFDYLREAIAGWSLPVAAQVALAILAPVLALHWLFDWLSSVLFGLPWLIGAVLILLYSFGRGDYRLMCDQFMEYFRRGDTEAAYLYAQGTLEIGLEGDAAGTSADVSRSVERELLYEGCQRLFAVLFYFVLLGPAGALAYRLVHLCRRAEAEAPLDGALFLLDWLPARLMAAAFTITGDFIGSREALVDVVFETDLTAGQVLQQVAEAAEGSANLEPDERISRYAALLSRSTAAWVVVLAVFVLIT